MKKLLIIGLILVAFIYGCNSVNVGGSGNVGTISGSGRVNIPIPK